MALDPKSIRAVAWRARRARHQSHREFVAQARQFRGGSGVFQAHLTHRRRVVRREQGKRFRRTVDRVQQFVVTVGDGIRGRTATPPRTASP
jgi:hypothetical protein